MARERKRDREHPTQNRVVLIVIGGCGTDNKLSSITSVMNRVEKKKNKFLKQAGGGVMHEQGVGMLPNPTWHAAEHEGCSVS